MAFYESLIHEASLLEKEMEAVRRKLRSAPEGRIAGTIDGRRTKWFHVMKTKEGSKWKYIAKADKAFALQLLEKQLDMCTLSDLQRRMEAVSLALSAYAPEKSQHVSFKASHPVFNDLYAMLDENNAGSIQKWVEADYPRNTNYAESLRFVTKRGDRVRSKSEMMIADALFENKIPYRYECLMLLDAFSCFPDFTILHPRTKETLIWEHFGLMDEESYAQNFSQKMCCYARNGWIPNQNLITTYETRERPLDARQILAAIENHLK